MLAGLLSQKNRVRDMDVLAFVLSWKKASSTVSNTEFKNQRLEPPGSRLYARVCTQSPTICIALLKCGIDFGTTLEPLPNVKIAGRKTSSKRPNQSLSVTSVRRRP